MKNLRIKTGVRFAATYFGLANVILILLFILFPKSYPGESFLIFWVYIINIPIGILLFPLFLRLFINMKSSFSILVYAVLYFLSILTIENIFPLIAMHRIIIFQIINLAFGKDEMSGFAKSQIANVFLSYIVTLIIFRRSNIWHPKSLLVEENV
jgi:hypothetical protein